METFDDMRPYHDCEINAAMQRITANPLFPTLAAYVYPDKTPQQVAQFMNRIHTVSDFQYSVMRALNEQVISRSIRNLTYNGIDNVPRHRACLFVSNHRDIVLDACLMQYILFLNHYPTTQITFGSNLMSSPLVVDIGRSNRMFRVERPGNGTARQFYEHSMRLSSYLHHAICTLGNSVWIAQRNGRTKDGIDRTSPAIVKMFGMYNRKDTVAALADLSIVPVSVSYMYEPCCILKARENLASQNGTYAKHPGEDLNSIITGITAYKGDVHFHFGTPLTQQQINATVQRDPTKAADNIAADIDRQIISGYKLNPTNYAAADILTGHRNHADKYTDADITALQQHLSEADNEAIRHEMLRIYANPVTE